jgi:hypothetical protein
VVNVYTAAQLVTPPGGCLLCNQTIDPRKLIEQSTSAEMRERVRYVYGADAAAPSVITLNSISARRPR